jgi:MOSC domain-containing protein YiiM
VGLMQLHIGDRLRVGAECLIELTDVRAPCRQLKKWDGRFPNLILGRSGWLAKVVAEGEVRAGDIISLVPRE